MTFAGGAHDWSGSPLGVIEWISRADCLKLLAEARFGRVVLSLDCLPVALPVNLTVIREDVYFTSADGTRLGGAVRNAVVSIQADEIDRTRRTGWSVLVTGVADIVTDAHLDDEVRADLSPWAPLENSPVVRVPSTRVTGRRLERRSPRR